MTSERIARVRAEEQQAAAEAIGAKHVVMLDHPDGMLEPDRVYLGEVVRAIRRFKPVTVLCHDPYRLKGFQHRDHRAVGITTMDAVSPSTYWKRAWSRTRSGTS
jgi:LmbE family N-acetylglucosaminyl deacetylase